MIAMSLTMHLAVLGVLILDLALGGWLIGRVAGRLATTAFEFAMIFGYIVFVLQWGVPWGNRDKEDSPSDDPR